MLALRLTYVDIARRTDGGGPDERDEGTDR
jgi:hypothetical protein